MHPPEFVVISSLHGNNVFWAKGACLPLAFLQHHAEQLVYRIAEPCKFNGTVLSITSSIGIALYPEDGETADILFKNADTAMYEAKGTEKRVVLFRTISH